MNERFNNRYLCVSLEVLYPFNEADKDKQHIKYILDFLTLVFKLSKIYSLDFWGTKWETEPKIYDTISNMSKWLNWSDSKVRRVLKYCKKMKWIKIKQHGIHGNTIIISKDVILLLDEIKG